MSTIKPIPDGYHTVTPYLIIRGASEAIGFYKQAFGAAEVLRLNMPGGLVGHAEIKIGDSHIMLGEAMPDMGFHGPSGDTCPPVSLHLYVEDSDAVFNRAVAAGAKVDRPVTDQFYGDRSGSVIDPYGHRWYISTHKEDLPFEEIERRCVELYGQ